MDNNIFYGFRGNISFPDQSSIFNYNLTIDNDIDKLEINPVPLDETNKVKIEDNKDLVDGSIIKINVINDSNEITTYKIFITKENNNLLLIGIGAIILLIITLIILIIVKSKQNKKTKTTNNKHNINNNEVEVLKL